MYSAKGRKVVGLPVTAGIEPAFISCMSLDYAANERRMTYKRQYETEYIVHVIQQLITERGRRIFFEHTNKRVRRGSPT